MAKESIASQVIAAQKGLKDGSKPGGPLLEDVASMLLFGTTMTYNPPSGPEAKAAYDEAYRHARDHKK